MALSLLEILDLPENQRDQLIERLQLRSLELETERLDLLLERKAAPLRARIEQLEQQVNELRLREPK